VLLPSPSLYTGCGPAGIEEPAQRDSAYEDVKAVTSDPRTDQANATDVGETQGLADIPVDEQELIAFAGRVSIFATTSTPSTLYSLTNWLQDRF